MEAVNKITSLGFVLAMGNFALFKESDAKASHQNCFMGQHSGYYINSRRPKGRPQAHHVLLVIMFM